MKKTLYVLACALCTLLVLPAAAQVPAYVPTDGLVGWWPFNGNANDESGNGNDGVVNGATLAEDRYENSDKAYMFDGNSYISIPNIPIQGNQNRTFCAWAKFNSDPPIGLSNYFISSGSSVTSGSFNMRLYNGKLNVMGFGTEGIDVGAEYDFNLTGNQWYLFSVTYDGDSIRFFFNGFLVDTRDVNPEHNTVGQNNFFGKSNHIGWEYYLNGTLDDIGIWNRALTEQEIQNLYTGTTPPPCVSLPSNLQQGLVGYWPFCGNANDESGNGNDGVVNGATLTEDRFGNANAAFSFDGNDWIESSAIGMANGNNSATISGWFKRSSNSSGVEYIAGYGNPNIPSGSVFATGEYGSQGAFATFLGSSFDAISGIQLPIDSWHQLTSVHTQDGQVFIYLDGQLSYTAIVQTPDIQNMITRIGRAVWESEEYWNGSLDDIGIWNRALTPEEVQELYTLDACTFTVQDTTYTNIELYDTITVENIVNVYDTTTIFETVYDTAYTNIEVFDTTTIVETEVVYDTITTENIVNVYDTSYITVTDTLLIDITFTGFEGQPSGLNTVIVYPNPANDHITIDYGNFALMAGYNTIITNAAGATVYSSAVNAQQVEIDINAWGSAGVYYMSIYDANGALAAVRHIVLE